MKKLSVLLALFLSLTLAAVVNAAPSADIDVNVDIQPELDLSWGMARVDSLGTADPADDVFTGDQSTMVYGDLTHTLTTGDEAGRWFSPIYYAVWATALTSGRPYTIQSQSEGLNSDEGVHLAKGWGVTSVKCWDTQANNGDGAVMDCPGDAAVGEPAPAEGTVVLYDSGSGAVVQTIRADYAIPNESPTTGTPFELIPLDQRTGAYSGLVTLSVVLK